MDTFWVLLGAGAGLFLIMAGISLLMWAAKPKKKNIFEGSPLDQKIRIK